MSAPRTPRIITRNFDGSVESPSAALNLYQRVRMVKQSRQPIPFKVKVKNVVGDLNCFWYSIDVLRSGHFTRDVSPTRNDLIAAYEDDKRNGLLNSDTEVINQEWKNNYTEGGSRALTALQSSGLLDKWGLQVTFLNGDSEHCKSGYITTTLGPTHSLPKAYGYLLFTGNHFDPVTLDGQATHPWPWLYQALFVFDDFVTRQTYQVNMEKQYRAQKALSRPDNGISWLNLMLVIDGTDYFYSRECRAVMDRYLICRFSPTYDFDFFPSSVNSVFPEHGISMAAWFPKPEERPETDESRRAPRNLMKLAVLRFCQLAVGFSYDSTKDLHFNALWRDFWKDLYSKKPQKDNVEVINKHLKRVAISLCRFYQLNCVMYELLTMIPVPKDAVLHKSITEACRAIVRMVHETEEMKNVPPTEFQSALNLL